MRLFRFGQKYRAFKRGDCRKYEKISFMWQLGVFNAKIYLTKNGLLKKLSNNTKTQCI